MSSHRPSKCITSSRNTSTLLMVSSFTRTIQSYPISLATYLKMSSTRVWPLWLPVLNQQYSNQASLQPWEPWGKTATTWLLHNSVLRPTASYSQHIPSTAFVPTVLNELHVPHCCGPLLQLAHHELGTGGIQGLINCLCRTFTNIWHAWWVHQDSGPEFTATTTCQFLKEWGVRQCLWSEAFPHSNCQAEIGVKIAKHFITNNTHGNAHGNIETDSLYRATLQYPDPNTKLSTAQCVFG